MWARRLGVMSGSYFQPMPEVEGELGHDLEGRSLATVARALRRDVVVALILDRWRHNQE